MSFESSDPRLDLPFDQTVLVLQGGGALGPYQAGAYEVLHGHGIRPDWISGISIGAINGALIAGNAPGDRIDALKTFWHKVGLHFPGDEATSVSDLADYAYRQMSGAWALSAGVQGFFRPWFLPPWFNRRGEVQATSFYDTTPLRQTLLELVDFDRINRGEMRLSVGAVHVRTGNFVYFDNRDRIITPDHILASGALPPGFPAVMIDGEPYWDGGLVSNTPLSYVLDSGIARDTLVFQVDLYSATGPDPATLDEVEERRKEIIYSSRTRMNTDAFLEKYRLRNKLRALARHVPPEVRAELLGKDDPADAFNGRVSLVHLINRANRREIQSKDYEFWCRSLDMHWQNGRTDAETAMQAESWRQLDDPETGLMVYDYIRPDKVRA